MEPVEKLSCDDYEESIKDVDPKLLGLELAVLAHDIFSNAKHRSYKDQEASCVEELLPSA